MIYKNKHYIIRISFSKLFCNQFCYSKAYILATSSQFDRKLQIFRYQNFCFYCLFVKIYVFERNIIINLTCLYLFQFVFYFSVLNTVFSIWKYTNLGFLLVSNNIISILPIPNGNFSNVVIFYFKF